MMGFDFENIDIRTMKYWIVSGGERKGPYELSELENAGIDASTLVWNFTLSDWTPAGNLPELSGLIPPPVPPGFSEEDGGVCPPPVPAAEVEEEEAESEADDGDADVGYPRALMWLSVLLVVLSVALLSLLFLFYADEDASLLFSPLPFAVLAVVFSALTRRRAASGDYEGAVRMARMNRVWLIVAGCASSFWMAVWLDFFGFGVY